MSIAGPRRRDDLDDTNRGVLLFGVLCAALAVGLQWHRHELPVQFDRTTPAVPTPAGARPSVLEVPDPSPLAHYLCVRLPADPRRAGSLGVGGCVALP